MITSKTDLDVIVDRIMELRQKKLKKKFDQDALL